VSHNSNPAPELGKSLKSRHVTMISIGGIIGAGLFVGSSASIATVGPGIILSYMFAGLVVLAIMRMLAEMAVAYPKIGSFTEFARQGLGNWAGFTNGWLYWYFWAIVAAIEALAGAGIVHDWLPQFQVWQIAYGLLTLMTAVNLLSTRSYGEFEFWFASIKVAAIIVFILVSVLFLTTHDPMGHIANLTAHKGFMPFGFSSVLGGVVSVIFALCGAEILTIAAAESAEPAKAVARLTSQVVVRILLFYVVSISLIVMVVPWDAIKAGTSPFATVLATMNVPAAAFAMNLIVLTAVLSCLNSAIYVTSRVLFTLAAKGDAPRALVALNSRKVPVRAILFSSLFGYLAILASVVSKDGAFAYLVNASGALMLFIYLITALAQVTLRRKLEATAPERLTVKVWFFPWVSYLAVAAMSGVLIAMAITPARQPELISSLICLGIVGAAYALIRRGRGQPVED
jgi:AAT family amino acid transporter/GABA permease